MHSLLKNELLGMPNTPEEKNGTLQGIETLNLTADANIKHSLRPIEDFIKPYIHTYINLTYLS